MPDNTITASARISESTWVQLKIMARKEGRTMNDLVGQALTEWLGVSDHGGQRDRENILVLS